MDKESIQKELAKRALAKKSLKAFVLLKWERYERKPFLDNWHYDYICKILENTLPYKPAQGEGENLPESQQRFFRAKALQNDKLTTPQKECHTQNQKEPPSAQVCNKELQNGEVFTSDFRGCEALRQGSLLNINDRSREANSLKSAKETSPAQKPEQLITRLILNMPPSYGKTEIIARCFIAWALGNHPTRKFFYISYSDDLCRKINNQVRDLLKSPFYYSIFGRNPEFLQDNANEFILKEGGGLFVTTLKSALTGFHAHQILIDDPIKVSAMNSKSERNLVNQNFKESVMSRLQDNKSNITILMQRLGYEDLCGFLLDSKNFDSDIINQWRVVSLKAMEDKEKTYTIGDYSYKRAAGEALFNKRHTAQELEYLKLQMGNDEFSTQYQQEPQVSEAGYFEKVYFKTIPIFECKANANLYIFVDNAQSLNSAADNRAITLIACENNGEEVRYIVKDCLYGIWSEEQTIENIITLMYENPSAKVYIESDGGGLTLERLLNAEIVRFNTRAKAKGQNAIINQVKCYTPSRKISKVEKIKALRPYYNTGALVFLHNARGLGQIQKELLSFNPAKPYRKDDCIDTIASAIMHEEVRAPFISPPRKERNLSDRERFYKPRATWNI